MRLAALAGALIVCACFGCGTKAAKSLDMSTSGDMAGTSKTGRVSLQSFAYVSPQGAPTAGYSANASFELALGRDAECDTTTVGACIVDSCTSGRGSDGGRARFVTESAGTIAIGGGATALTMVPDDAKGYAALTNTDALFNGGEKLTIALGGGDVPAATLAVIAPTAPTISAPSPSATPLAIARDTPFTVAWSGGGAGHVVIEVLAPPAAAVGAPYGRVRCAFAATGGGGSVPAALLGPLPAGPAQFTFTPENRVTITDGDWSLDGVAGTTALAPDGKAFLGGVATLN